MLLGSTSNKEGVSWCVLIIAVLVLDGNGLDLLVTVLLHLVQHVDLVVLLLLRARSCHNQALFWQSVGPMIIISQS